MGTIVDAIIEAPARRPRTRPGRGTLEMHQIQEGEPVAFRDEGHIGVDCETGIVHSITATAANGA